MPVHAAAIVNPRKAGDPDRARAMLAAAAADAGAPPPVWIETSRDDPGAGQARQAIAGGAQLVMAWGGDGTVVAVAGAVAHTGVPLGVIPGGTANLLARNLGIPLRTADAIANASQGVDRVIDLLDVDLGHGEHTVSAVMCGAGWDAAMMAAPEALKKRLAWGAYAVAGARQIRQRPMQLQISVDGSSAQELSGRTVLIANVGSLVAGLNLVPEAAPDDGLLEVLVIDPSSPVDWVRTTAALVRAKGSDGDPARTLFRGREAIVRTGHSRKRQVDGDLVSDGAGFHVRVMPQALTVRVPTEARQHGVRR